MSNIFNDRTDTELNERTINFQNLSVADTTIPVLGLNNVVSGQVAGIAGLDLLSKETLDDVKEEVLGSRLKNLSTVSFASESVATIDENDIVSTAPIRTAGKTIIAKETVAEIQTTVLETRLKNLKDASITIESVPTITNNTVSSAPIRTAGKDIISKETVAEIQTTVLETRLKNLKDASITIESVPTITNNTVSSAPIGTAGKTIISKETVAEIQTTVLETRLKNLKDASITIESVPTITNNTVSSAPIGTAGKTIISKETVAEIQTTVLETRLKNLKDASITIESVPTITNNTVSSVPILQGGKDILNQTQYSSNKDVTIRKFRRGCGY